MAVLRVMSVHVTSNQFAFSTTTTRVRYALYSLVRVSCKSFATCQLDSDAEIHAYARSTFVVYRGTLNTLCFRMLFDRYVTVSE